MLLSSILPQRYEMFLKDKAYFLTNIAFRRVQCQCLLLPLFGCQPYPFLKYRLCFIKYNLYLYKSNLNFIKYNLYFKEVNECIGQMYA